VILSQIWRGLSQGLAEKEQFTCCDFADAFTEASKAAYKGLSNPVEGTILTVIREASLASQVQADTDNNDLLSVMEAAVTAANEAVANTPTLLPVLREAGVVDAGGSARHACVRDNPSHRIRVSFPPCGRSSRAGCCRSAYSARPLEE
jgi:dihydroxyacetone kinase-like predicted kinase